jgi:hypothetical protein
MKKYPGYIMAIFICFSITYMAMTFMNDEKADAAADDVMLLNEPSYEHKKGIIQFTHIQKNIFNQKTVVCVIMITRVNL